jgi:hypothetical protein
MKRLDATATALLVAALLVLPLSALAEESRPYRVAVAEKLKLQDLLDEHRSLKLDSNSDYRTGGIAKLKMSSGQRIEGGWNTRVPQIEIPGGASNVFLSGIRGDAPAHVDVVFSGGAENNDVQIIGGSGGSTTNIRVLISAGARVNRLRLSEFGGLEVQQAESGYVRDSNFTRLLGYWEGPHVLWHGNLSEPSHGNVFLGLSSITPQRGSLWSKTGDLQLVGWDCESWNSNGRGPLECFVIDEVPRVVSIGLSGGTAYPAQGGALAKFHDVQEFIGWFSHGHGGERATGDILFDAVGTAVLTQSARETREVFQHDPQDAQRVRILHPMQTPDVDSVNGTPLDQRVAEANDSWLPATYGGATVRAALPKPTRRSIEDGLGASWRNRLAERPDSASMLQARIDREGIVRVDAGVYYLERPLRIGSHKRVEGLIGSHRDAVYLVAKGNFPVIEGRGGRRYAVDGESPLTIVLSDMTLYGGSYGASFTGGAEGAGDGAQIAWSTFSNLKFMKQTRAGVLASGILGFDSNFWYRVDFYDMPVAIRGEGNGIAAGMNYADKQYFLDCQFQQIRDAVWYWTADRQSGGQIWQDDYFHDVGGISRTRAAANMLWANTVMEDITGPVGIDVVDAGKTATYYFYLFDCLVMGMGPHTFADTLSYGNAVLYIDSEFRQRGGQMVGSQIPQSFFAVNSRLSGSAKLGPVTEGVMVDSSFGDRDRKLQVVRSGKVKIIDNSPVNPRMSSSGP